jgi:hypothetical protein
MIFVVKTGSLARIKEIVLATCTATNREHDVAILRTLKRGAGRILSRSCEGQLLYLVLEGDWGGQIFLTVPWHKVGPEAKIVTLLDKMNKAAWSCNVSAADDGSNVKFFLAEASQSGVPGGMGGGLLTNGVWMHDDFANRRKQNPDKESDKLLMQTNWKQLVAQLLDI